MIQFYIIFLIFGVYSILSMDNHKVKRIRLVFEKPELDSFKKNIWATLPYEIKIKILKTLKLSDLINFSQVDQETKAIVLHELKKSLKASSYNWALSPNKIKAFQGHYDWVSQIKISKDNNFMVIVGGEDFEDKIVKVWDIKTNKCLHSLIGHDDCILAVEISSDSKLIVTCSGDETTKIWDSQTGVCKATLVGHGKAVNSVAISKDNKFVITGSDSSVAHMWDVQTGAFLKTFLRFETYCVGPIKISGNNKFIVIGSHGIGGLYMAEIWDVEEAEPLHNLIGHSQAIVSIEISEDNKFIVTGSFDNRAMIWDAQTGDCLHTLAGHNGHINSVKISSDSKFVVTVSSDKTAKIWDAQTGACLHTLIGHNVELYSLAISPDNSFVVTGSMNRSSVNVAKIWDINTGEYLKTLISVNAKNKCLSIGLYSPYTIISKEYRMPKIVNSNNGLLLSEIPCDSGLPINSIIISSDSSFIAISSDDNSVKLWFISQK